MHFTKKKILLITSSIVFLLLLTSFWFCLPSPLFNTPTSSILEAENGDLLTAKIAKDGQWRFPTINEVPEKFKQCIVAFEDKNFDKHWGIDFLSLAKAIKLNIQEGKIVRGASTITMQVMRIARKNQKRTILEKAIECVQALRIELTYSKKEILQLYASEAPFGGNVVGLEAASWRYFGRSPDKLSWAESATLAVLPNSPSLIFPGKNQERLKIKRDKLLIKLKEKGIIDAISLRSALMEPVPGPPHNLPYIAPHLLTFCEKQGLSGKRNTSTIDGYLQKRINKILQRHYDKLSGNGIHNAAAIVLEVETGKVLSYCGNIISDDKDKMHGNDVDIIQSKRSTGSILKPLLFSMILNEGKLLSKSLVADIPTLIAGYAPKNYYLTYDGAVSFQSSISRSLNVPAVRLLQDYGYEKFNIQLKKLGMSSLTKPANHYGLSIILGGSEGSLWDMASIYRNLANGLNQYHANLNQSKLLHHYKPVYLTDQLKTDKSTYSLPITPSSIYLMMEAMNEVNRPEEETGWKDYASAYKIAWKTGTSFGYRDGWAIGCTPQYVVAVWVGNADGEGRPELTGISTAAPIMFDIFKLLKSNHWFMQPYNDMQKSIVCRKSGYRASDICELTDTIWIQKQGGNSPLCPYHKTIHLDPTSKFRVNSQCESVNNMNNINWFVLPPAMEYYFKTKNSTYIPLPPFRSDCPMDFNNAKSFDIIYPQHNSKIYIPIELDGKSGKTVFQVAHRRPGNTLFWYIDSDYLGLTKDFHEIAANPEPGQHKLTIMDETGESRVIFFEVLEKR